MYTYSYIGVKWKKSISMWCYVVNGRILANQIRVFLIFKIRFKYGLIYVEKSKKVHLT